MKKHEEKNCPMCESKFECKVGSILLCQCSQISLTDDEIDYIKTKYALSKRINLLRIKYTELPKINQILETVFKKSS